MPRDHRHALAVAEAQTSTEGQRPCSRGQWCASRTVAIVDGERVVTPALGYRAFCDHDTDLIGNCTADLPGIFLRLTAELHRPAATETHVHVPFGPSIPVRLDVDAAMRLTATRLAMWEARVRAMARETPRDPGAPVLSAKAVRDAAKSLARQLPVLLTLQSAWMTHNISVPPGKLGAPGGRGARAMCRLCGRRISRSPFSGKWWAADGITGFVTSCEHKPDWATVILPALAPVSPELEDEYGDAEIVRVGADFLGLFIERDGAAAGLELLHLHYWNRAVLRETPARPEELIGVECKACSLRALRRAEPAWFTGDPDYYSECAECGDLMTEDDYRHWVAQLHAYEKARMAAMPTLSDAPVGG